MHDELRIGDWTFHPQLNQLTSSGGEAHLEPRSAAVLIELARVPGHVRSRDELLDAVWGDAFVGEAVLTQSIFELRRAFGDRARDSEYIQTIPRRGYRLVAPVEPVTGAVLRTLLRVGFKDASEGSAGGRTAGDDRDTSAAWNRIAERLGGYGRAPTVIVPGCGLLLFKRPVEAVRLALDLCLEAARPAQDGGLDPGLRCAVHLGEVPGGFAARCGPDPLPPAVRLAGSVLSLAQPRQILLTRAAFDLARGSSEDLGHPASELRWLAHGAYALSDSPAAGLEAGAPAPETVLPEPVPLFEVGREGVAPLRPPVESSRGRRALGDGIIQGWRAAQGLAVPHRPHWVLRRKLGEGGFGEVWLAAHEAAGEQRVFKFCYEAERLRALQREVTLFRLLKETLGERRDIVRILDWSFDRAPYYLEIEHTESGSLPEWADLQGALDQVPMALRLEIVAQIAEALAAAHSVGVLHKDVKPGNILIASRPDSAGEDSGGVQARLTDFGISRVTDRDLFAKAGITALGLTGTATTGAGPSDSGTRLYQAPEVLEGKPFTVRADLYALGVVLYQMVVGELERAVALGWDRNVDDPLLVETIAACVDGAPERRPASASEIAEALRTLEQRRQRRAARRREREEAAANRRALEASRRRRRALGAVAAATGVFLMVVSAFAVRAHRARLEAEAARQQAEWRHEQAEGLIGFMLGDLRDKLEPLGRLDILEAVGDRAMGYFGKVPEGHWSEEERDRRAQAFRQIGEVRMAQGDLAAAHEAFRASLALLPASGHLAGRPGDPPGGRVAAVELQMEALRRIGQVERSEGDLVAAEAAFRDSLELAEALAAAAPQDGGRQMALCAALFWVGQIRFDQGDYAAARDFMARYLKIAETWTETLPEDDAWRFELAQATSNVGSVAEKIGDLPAALSAYRRRLGILQELVAKDPSQMVWKLDLALAHNTVGVALAARGKLREAHHHFTADLGIKQALVASDPASALWSQRLATSHFFLGTSCWQQGRLGEARAHFRGQLRIAEDLVQRDPRNGHWQRELAVAERSLARVLGWEGGVEPALSRFDRAEEILRTLALREPQHRNWQLQLVKTLLARGLVLDGNGDSRAALTEAREALSLLEGIDPSDPELESESLLLWGMAHQALGRTGEARGAWLRSLERIEPLARASGQMTQVALWARALLLLDRRQAAEEPLAVLKAAGYQDPEILRLTAS